MGGTVVVMVTCVPEVWLCPSAEVEEEAVKSSLLQIVACYLWLRCFYKYFCVFAYEVIDRV